ncbi:MAG: hypothetical protein AAF211_18340, partial [Myxococcota bacterium]
WAYAGFFFNLTGAAVAHASVPDAGWVPPLVLLAVLGVSYYLRPAALVPAFSTDGQPATA